MKISFHLFSNTSAWRDGPIIIQTCQKNLFALQQKSISPIPTAIKHTEIPHEIGDQLNLLLYLYIYFYLKLVFVFVTIHPLYFLECLFCVPWKLSLFCPQDAKQGNIFFLKVSFEEEKNSSSIVEGQTNAKKLASLGARLVQNYDPPARRPTRAGCRATRVINKNLYKVGFLKVEVIIGKENTYQRV